MIGANKNEKHTEIYTNLMLSQIKASFLFSPSFDAGFSPWDGGWVGGGPCATATESNASIYGENIVNIRLRMTGQNCAIGFHRHFYNTSRG